MTARRDRYGEPAADPVPPATTEHDPRCRDGWLGADGDGHPAPCLDCKPWLAACPTCGASRKRCEFDRAMLRSRCCPQCPHTLPVTKTRRKRAKTQEPSQ